MFSLTNLSENTWSTTAINILYLFSYPVISYISSLPFPNPFKTETDQPKKKLTTQELQKSLKVHAPTGSIPLIYPLTLRNLVDVPRIVSSKEIEEQNEIEIR